MPTRMATLLTLMALSAAACGGGETPQTIAQQVTSPSQVASGGDTIAAFGGTWTSGSEAGAAPAGTCTNLQWRLPTVAGSTGTGNFEATCNGVQISATVTVAMSASSTLAWRVAGRTTQNGRACEFSLSGTAVAVRPAGMQVDYRGTVCGTPVSGSQVWQRS